MEKRLRELDQMPAPQRIAAIGADLAEISERRTAAMVFHRKALLRLHDRARLEAGLVTKAVLQRENSSVEHLDFATAHLSLRARVRECRNGPEESRSDPRV